MQRSKKFQTKGKMDLSNLLELEDDNLSQVSVPTLCEEPQFTECKIAP